MSRLDSDTEIVETWMCMCADVYCRKIPNTWSSTISVPCSSHSFLVLVFLCFNLFRKLRWPPLSGSTRYLKTKYDSMSKAISNCRVRVRICVYRLPGTEYMVLGVQYSYIQIWYDMTYWVYHTYDELQVLPVVRRTTYQHTSYSVTSYTVQVLSILHEITVRKTLYDGLKTLRKINITRTCWLNHMNTLMHQVFSGT